MKKATVVAELDRMTDLDEHAELREAVPARRVSRRVLGICGP